MTTPRERSIALSEIVRVIALALDSNSEDVHTFAKILPARIAAIVDGAELEPLSADEEAKWVVIAKQLQRGLQ